MAVNIRELKPYRNNPRRNDGAVEAVADSIREFGFRNPIIIDRNNEIIAGHTRYKAAKRLKLKSVPCIMADEKCLFVMKGVQMSSANADNYYEGWEPLRGYLDAEMEKCGGRKNWKKALGNEMGKHYFIKSQWTFPTEENYRKLQAFGKEYGALRREWYATRAYFNNTHDNMNNVWHFGRTSQEERKLTGGHATPKPVALCARGIKSSSQVGDIVVDLFGGSGTTMIAAEQLGRKCRMMELDARYCDVIVRRWEQLTGKKAEKTTKTHK